MRFKSNGYLDVGSNSSLLMEPFAWTDNNPSAKSVSMLNLAESKRQCPKRLRHFFNFLELQGELKDQSSSFVKQFKNKADEGGENSKENYLHLHDIIKKVLPEEIDIVN